MSSILIIGSNMNSILVHPPDGCDRWFLRIDWLPEGVKKIKDSYYLLERKLTQEEKDRIGIPSYLTEEERTASWRLAITS